MKTRILAILTNKSPSKSKILFSIFILCVFSWSVLTIATQNVDGSSLKETSNLIINTTGPILNNVTSQSLFKLDSNGNLPGFHYTFSGLDKYDVKLNDLVYKTIDGKSILTPVNTPIPAKINSGYTLLSKDVKP